MHILVTLNSFWNIWNFRRPLIETLKEKGHEITVLAPIDDKAVEVAQMGCNVVNLDMDVKGINPLEVITLVRKFKNIFQRENPDIVLSYTIKNNVFGAIAAKQCGIPFIPNISGLGTAFLSGRIVQLLAQFMYRQAFNGLPHIFFQNPDDLSFFLARKLIQPKQAQLLPGSGIDLEHFSIVDYPKHSETPTFLMVARLLRDKGVIEYVQAAQMVKAIYPNVRFRLLGDADAANRTAIGLKTVQSWHNEGIVDYLGYTDDVRPYIASSSCVVLPSYREGAPRSLIEASAMARPVIATDVPGCRSVVQDGFNGLLCDVGSSKSLADACLEFLKLSYDQKSAMGRSGRAKMEREFDQALVIQVYCDAIDSTKSRI